MVESMSDLTMPALVFDATGDPLDVLRWEERPVPARESGSVLIDVVARPIHPADHAFIRGRYRVRPQFPQIAGLEGAGVIRESGDSEEFTVGQRVAFRWPGSWAGISAVPVERLIAVPDDVDDNSACQVSLNPLTAWGLVETAQLTAGDWVVITAATSTLANLIAAICRVRHIKTLGIVRGSAEQAGPRCGTDAIVSTADPKLHDTLLDLTGGGIGALLDSVGGPLLSTLLPALRAGAHVLAYGVQDPTPVPITNAMLIYSNLTWIGFGIDRWLAGIDVTARQRAHSIIWSMIREHNLELPVAATVGLEDFRRGLQIDAAPGRAGKVLLM
jgi:NADPH:quinone reductase-like Zn-dependent oxidoreductase